MDVVCHPPDAESQRSETVRRDVVLVPTTAASVTDCSVAHTAPHSVVVGAITFVTFAVAVEFADENSHFLAGLVSLATPSLTREGLVKLL